MEKLPTADFEGWPATLFGSTSFCKNGEGGLHHGRGSEKTLLPKICYLLRCSS